MFVKKLTYRNTFHRWTCTHNILPLKLSMNPWIHGVWVCRRDISSFTFNNIVRCRFKVLAGIYISNKHSFWVFITWNTVIANTKMSGKICWQGRAGQGDLPPCSPTIFGKYIIDRDLTSTHQIRICNTSCCWHMSRSWHIEVGTCLCLWLCQRTYLQFLILIVSWHSWLWTYHPTYISRINIW